MARKGKTRGEKMKNYCQFRTVTFGGVEEDFLLFPLFLLLFGILLRRVIKDVIGLHYEETGGEPKKEEDSTARKNVFFVGRERKKTFLAFPDAEKVASHLLEIYRCTLCSPTNR